MFISQYLKRHVNVSVPAIVDFLNDIPRVCEPLILYVMDDEIILYDDLTVSMRILCNVN